MTHRYISLYLWDIYLVNVMKPCVSRDGCLPTQATSRFKRTFNPLKQEEADPGPARVALAAPAHAVLSHGCV